MKQLLLFLIFISSIQFSHAQEYYIFGKDTLDTKGLKRVLKKSKRTLISKKVINSKNKLDYRIKKATISNGIVYNEVDIIIVRKSKNEKLYNLLNKPLPDFLLHDLEGKLTSSFFIKGRPTLLYLWFINCPPCVKEIPELNRIKKIYTNQMNFIAITFDEKEKVKKFLKKKEFTYLMLTNAKPYLSENLGNASYPKIILIDKNGIIRGIHSGIPTSNKGKSEKIKYHSNSLIKHIESLI